ncbi:hypothetical protein TRIATDRAFT_256907, partial [Trichoderma atroviride IMI 206040]
MCLPVLMDPAKFLHLLTASHNQQHHFKALNKARGASVTSVRWYLGFGLVYL